MKSALKPVPLICSILALALAQPTAQQCRAQEIEATVSVNFDKLPSASQQDVLGFSDELLRYLNTTRWITNTEWKGDKVQLNVNVTFTGASSDGAYGATLVVGSQRKLAGSGNLSPVMKVLDDKWVFRYSRGQPLYQDLSGYDPLSSLIDFYAYTALGLELDTRQYLGGSAMYEVARQILNRAQTRTGNSDGWDNNAQAGKYSRFNLIRELTDLRYNPLRKFIFDYHTNALDLLETNRTAGLDTANACLSDLVRAIDKLVEPTVLVRMLTDAKHLELAGMFVGYSDPLVWRKLFYIDPRHQSVYEAARDKR